MSDVNTANDFLFGSNGETVQPMMPVVIATQEQAYRTSVWLWIMGITLPHEEKESTYEEIREAISNT